jgi:outer membrane protein OmpU
MQYQRLLLGSTALVGAGILLAGAPPAKAAGMQVKLSGYTEFEVGGATKDTYNNSNHNQNYSFFMDNEVHIEATATSDSGVTYGSYLEIEIGSNSDAAQNGNVSVDEVNLFFSGNFGRVELGQQDGAEDVMFVGAEDAQSGTGGIDGDTSNLAVIINVQNTGDATKATYFTPRVAGFQLGASFSPNTQSQFGQTDEGGQKDAISVGGNWVGAFGGADLTLSAVGISSQGNNRVGNTNSNGNVKDYSVGGVLGFGGLSFGVTWGQLLDGIASTKDTGLRVGNGTSWLSGSLQYSFGPASASVGVDQNWLDGQKDLTVLVVSADYGIMPGVTLKGDVSYNTNDPGANAGDPQNPDPTLAGVASVQIDY